MLSNAVNRSAKDLFQYYYIILGLYQHTLHKKLFVLAFHAFKIQSRVITLFDPLGRRDD